jgi:3-dehydroquinate dehydratase/shikimate dehydrogenase
MPLLIDVFLLCLQVALDFLANLQGREASGCKVIVSNHNFQSTPSAEELRTMIARMESTGADIIKFVTTANKFTDVVTVLEVLRDCQVS